MKYSVRIQRSFYDDTATRTRFQSDEQFFNSIDVALVAYNSSKVGEQIGSEIHSYTGSTNFHVSLNVYKGEERIKLESVFFHNGEVH